MSIEAKELHTGQYGKYGDYYGDYFREWAITTDKSVEEALEWCFTNLYPRRVPCSSEWHKNIKMGGEKSGDMNYYFNGYYELTKIEKGFIFKVCQPYAD